LTSFAHSLLEVRLLLTSYPALFLPFERTLAHPLPCVFHLSLHLSFPLLLNQLVLNGAINESRVEDSAARILQLKEDLGLFENPFGNPSNPNIEAVGGDWDLSLQIAQESITLLKNQNDLLPLSTTNNKILVTGPAGNSLAIMNGGWSIEWQGLPSDEGFPGGVTLYQGVESICVDNCDVQYIQGCNFTDLTDSDLAVAAAKQSQFVILAVGEGPEAEMPGDINDLTISPSQQQLFALLQATGTPIILVLAQARPRLLNDMASADAILLSYLPSSMGGQAIAEIIFGEVNPSGKLPLTYPQFSGDIGVPYYHLPSQTAVTDPLFPFGFGLSYTNFDYSNLTLSTSSLPMGGSLLISLIVSNTGQMSGKESVLLFVSDEYASVSPEVKMLRNFRKITLDAGAFQEVLFTITMEDLTFIGRNDQPTIEPGTFVVQVGSLSQQFELLPQ